MNGFLRPMWYFQLLSSGYHNDATGFSGHDYDGRDEGSHLRKLGSPCTETRVSLVETQAEMRGCNRIEQISPLSDIDGNKVKPSSLSSSSLGIKIIAVDDLLADHVPDSASFVASDIPAADSELPSTTTRTTLPTETATTPRGFCPCCSRSDICLIRRWIMLE